MTGSDLQARGIDDAELVLVTPEEEPLQLFGHPAADAVRQLLEERGISLRTRSGPVAFTDSELRLQTGKRSRPTAW